jgi:glycosyltransferase involved in cell wall biosynthesis
VIGSRLGGIAEIVKDKFNGLLFEPGDEDSLIRSLTSLKTMI